MLTKLKIGLCVLSSFFTIAAANQPQWPGLTPDCWTKPRTYHSQSMPNLWEANTNIISIKKSKPQPGTLSPNNGYFFKLSGGRPSATVTIYSEKDHLIQIVFSNLYGLSEVRWINEKLLFLRPWWGRIQGTDMIYDVEKEAILYAESITDGSIAYQQFQESCPITTECECIKKK